jgi:hypothetical protein
MEGAMTLRIRDGAALMRTSFQLVRGDRALLWYPVASTCCLLLTAGFWVYEGAWLWSVHGSSVLYVPLVLVAVYSLIFVGTFFNVALAAAAAAVLAGRAGSFGDGMNVAWSRLGSIAGWAAYSLFVAVALSFVQRLNRWAGTAAEIAWGFATFFVVPLIALEGLGARAARRRSFELARMNMAAESGGLGALKAAIFVPMLLCALAYEALKGGHVHSHGVQALLGCAVFLGVVLGALAGVVRQVFAVSLYRASLS